MIALYVLAYIMAGIGFSYYLLHEYNVVRPSMFEVTVTTVLWPVVMAVVLAFRLYERFELWSDSFPEGWR